MQKLNRTSFGLIIGFTLLALAGCKSPTEAVYQPGIGTNSRDSQVHVYSAAHVKVKPRKGLLVASLVNTKNYQDKLLQLKFEQSDAATKRPEISQVSTNLVIPAKGVLDLSKPGFAHKFNRLRLTPGDYLNITFVFQKAKPLTLSVPVVLPENEYAQYAPKGNKTKKVTKPTPHTGGH